MRRYKIEFDTDDKENPTFLDGYMILKLNEQELEIMLQEIEKVFDGEDWDLLQDQTFEEDRDGKQYIWFTTEYVRGEITDLKSTFKDLAKDTMKLFTDRL